MEQKIIHLLLIEDNPGDVRLIREMILGDPGQIVRMRHVATLQSGLDCLQEQEFDVILLDLSLPDSQGVDTLLRVSAAVVDTAIVVLTGNDNEELGIRAVQIGAQDYLPKSLVDAKLLIRALRYAIERHRIEVMIRKSEEEYRSLINDVFHTSMVAVLILNREYRIVWCNEATEIYFGISRDRLIGKDSRVMIEDELKCIFADPDDYAARLLKAYEDGEHTDRFECHIVGDVYRDERWLEHWSQPIRDGMYAGGRIEQYTDITDRKKLEIAEEEQRRFAEALRDIATVLTSTLNLNEVLGRILSNLGRIIPHDSASITLMEDDHIWVAEQRRNPTRDTQELVAEKQLQVEYSEYLEEMYQTGNLVIVHDLQADQEMQSAAKRANIRSYMGAPIKLQKEMIGFMNVFSEQVSFFTQSHAERLTAFAELAAIAIQNARLYERSQNLAAFEERQRLARDLHDSVSQTLYTCRNIAETALRRWEKDPVRARNLMEEVYDLTRTALAEMRILLMELRPAALTQVSLKQLFEQYLQPIQERRQFKLKLEIEEIPPLPPDVQIAMYRIVQEALNNIDKHAGASQVIVLARNNAEGVELQISDDGVGFNVENIRTTSLGLGIMRERADSIQASLMVESENKKGTRITVEWRKP